MPTRNRNNWTTEQDTLLRHLIDHRLADLRPSRGRKGADEMTADAWWDLVARQLRRRLGADGASITGRACSRRARTLATLDRNEAPAAAPQTAPTPPAPERDVVVQLRRKVQELQRSLDALTAEASDLLTQCDSLMESLL